MPQTLLLGQTLSFDASPFEAPAEHAARHDTHGAVLIEDGRITATGPRDQLRAQAPKAQVQDLSLIHI